MSAAVAELSDTADKLAMNLPAELTRSDRKQFLLWRYEDNPGGGKPRKVPYYANGRRRNGTQGEPADLAQLVTFSEALECLEAGGYSGLGIAMVPGGGLVGVDLDNCYLDGVLNPGLKPLIQGTYPEISPGGAGVRAFYSGEYPDRKHLEKGIEIFCQKGFLTLTGNRISADDIIPHAGYGSCPPGPAFCITAGQIEQVRPPGRDRSKGPSL